jgi:hypothetical protein
LLQLSLSTFQKPMRISKALWFAPLAEWDQGMPLASKIGPLLDMAKATVICKQS